MAFEEGLPKSFHKTFISLRAMMYIIDDFITWYGAICIILMDHAVAGFNNYINV